MFFENKLDLYEHLCELKSKLKLEIFICRKYDGEDIFDKCVFKYRHI